MTVVMVHLPEEIVDVIIDYACCNKFVLVDESPVYELRRVEHPPKIAERLGGFSLLHRMGMPQEGWYYIRWLDVRGDGQLYWDYADFYN